MNQANTRLIHRVDTRRAEGVINPMPRRVGRRPRDVDQIVGLICLVILVGLNVALALRLL